MDRVLLNHLPVVLSVARTRSFVRAAAELGLGASAVSHAVRSVEDRLGAPLFARTTRSVALTEAGVAFITAAEHAMEGLQAAVERVRADQGEITGTLRINAPRVALSMALTPILRELAQRHPRLAVEVISDDALTDVTAAGFDAGVRLGEMVAQDMVAVRLTPPFRAVVVAAPSYLARRGAPQRVEDLGAHDCIGFRLLGSGAVYAWDLARDGEDVKVEVSGPVRVSDPTYGSENSALEGLGLAYIFEPLVASELANGRLVEVLTDASVTEPGLFLYFPRRSGRDAKLRALIEAVKAVRRG